jgi:DNA/RNA endonuclease YhcR with UshA esterase domain
MRAVLLVAIACLTLAVPVAAWKGEPATATPSLAEVKENAEKGDILVVEGRITDVGTASGSSRLVTLDDGTGTVLVRVPENMLRRLNDGKDPQVGRRVRVTGRWDHAYLDKNVWGIQALDAERIE